MKLLFDFFPVLLFFVAYKFADIYTATAVAIGATALQVAWAHFVRRKVEPMLWFSAAVVVVFGTLTLVLHNPTFIKWKPTVLYWAMGAGLAISTFVMGKSAIRALLGEQIQLPDIAWRKLELSWIGFFAVMGVLNLVVAYSFEEDTWVNFKLFGGIGLMLVFVILQSLMLSRYMEEK